MKNRNGTKGNSYISDKTGRTDGSYSLKIFRGSKGEDSVNDAESGTGSGRGFVRVTSEWEVVPNRGDEEALVQQPAVAQMREHRATTPMPF